MYKYLSQDFKNLFNTFTELQLFYVSLFPLTSSFFNIQSQQGNTRKTISEICLQQRLQNKNKNNKNFWTCQLMSFTHCFGVMTEWVSWRSLFYYVSYIIMYYISCFLAASNLRTLLGFNSKKPGGWVSVTVPLCFFGKCIFQRRNKVFCGF